MTYLKTAAKISPYYFAFFCLLLLLPGQARSFQLTPPKNIVHKQQLPIKGLNFIRTQEGITYLISEDGRYVFQGALFDVWNGEQIEGMGELKQLEDRVNFAYLGVDPQKMFALDLGEGKDAVFVFADPNCGVCHSLLKKIKASKQIQAAYRIYVVIVPILGPSSRDKALKLAQKAKTDAPGALNDFIENRYSETKPGQEKDKGLDYNILLTKALGINKVPYIVNSHGRIMAGMPEELALFLLKK